MTLEPATLYMVATPIGNLEDITLRALEVLKGVDFIYAEDTRVTRKLLDRYGIKAQLRSYREAASSEQLARMIKDISAVLFEGQTVAYVSDAGTPGVSDPGSYLVRHITAQGYNVSPVPGPSALTAILSSSGFTSTRPLFVGFLPKKKGHQTLVGQLKAALEQGVCDTIVLYESPERIVKLLQELEGWQLPLLVCVGREVTKLHEEWLRGTTVEVIKMLSEKPSIKGEITLAISLSS